MYVHAVNLRSSNTVWINDKKKTGWERAGTKNTPLFVKTFQKRQNGLQPRNKVKSAQ